MCGGPHDATLHSASGCRDDVQTPTSIRFRRRNLRHFLAGADRPIHTSQPHTFLDGDHSWRTMGNRGMKEWGRGAESRRDPR